MTKLTPENEKKGWTWLTMCCYDEDYDVRRRAINQLLEMTKLAPENGNKAWELLSKCCFDKERFVRQWAFHQIPEIIKLAPECGEKAWELLSKCCHDEDYDIRCRAINTLSDTIKLTPDYREKAWTLLMTCSQDEFGDVRSAVINQLLEIARLVPENANKALQLLMACCNDEKRGVRTAAVGQIAAVPKFFPVYGNEAWRTLSACCYHEDQNVRMTAIDLLSDFRVLLPRYEEEIIILLSKLCDDEEVAIREKTIIQKDKIVAVMTTDDTNEENSKEYSDFSQTLPSSSDEVDNAYPLSESENLMKCERGTLEGIDTWSTLSEACSNSSVDVRIQVAKRIERFANRSYQNLSNACILLCKLCADSSVSVRQKAFDLLVKLWKSNPKNYMLSASHILELAYDIGTDHEVFLIIEIAAELLETEHEEEALDMLFKAASNRAKTHKLKALECLQRIPLQKLLDIIRSSNLQKGLNVLVQSLLTTTYITFDSNCQRDNEQFIIVEAKGTSETKTPLSDGRILVNAVQEFISIEYPEFLDVLSPFSIQLEARSSSND